MRKLIAIGMAAAAAPAFAQGGVSSPTASTGSVSTATTGTLSGTGTSSSGTGLGVGLGSGSLSGVTSAGGAGAVPGAGGSNFGRPDTPLGTQSSLSARINAAARLAPASQLNARLGAGGASYGASGAGVGGSGVAGLSASTTLSNAGQPAGRPLGQGN